MTVRLADYLLFAWQSGCQVWDDLTDRPPGGPRTIIIEAADGQEHLVIWQAEEAAMLTKAQLRDYDRRLGLRSPWG